MRYLVVTADDFGIGPGTTRGILDLAARGRVTAAVLLVNSPHAASAVQAWRRAGSRPELGWHPCLTLDAPLSRRCEVPTLVDEKGRFYSLPTFLWRLWSGRVRPLEIEAELGAQYERFVELVGAAPALVNCHHHLQVFRPVRKALVNVLKRARCQPYLRRVREPTATLWHLRGARCKRLFLGAMERVAGGERDFGPYPGNDWLAGITDSPYVADPECFTRWLRRVPGRVVELACHPGYRDETLNGRDDDPQGRRETELRRLHDPSFLQACRARGFVLIPPSVVRACDSNRGVHAA